MKVLIVTGLLLILIALGLAYITVSGIGETVLSTNERTFEEADNIQTAQVVSVIDGETIILKDQRRVRYLGLRVPTLAKSGQPAQCFAAEAKAANEKLTLGKTVRLEKDVTNRDPSGKLLRYVYVNDNEGHEIFVNDYLLRFGFARFFSPLTDTAQQDTLLLAVQRAQFQERGLWLACPGQSR